MKWRFGEWVSVSKCSNYAKITQAGNYDEEDSCTNQNIPRTGRFSTNFSKFSQNETKIPCSNGVLKTKIPDFLYLWLQNCWYNETNFLNFLHHKA
jgi:hypothetical protein